jgi:hypothetical protein
VFHMTVLEVYDENGQEGDVQVQATLVVDEGF